MDRVSCHELLRVSILHSIMQKGTVAWPRVASGPVRHVDRTYQMRTETEAVESRRRGHVLIVDDDPDTQFIFLAALEYAGYRVRIEADGVGALVAIRQEVPDIVILDLAMPLLSGL